MKRRPLPPDPPDSSNSAGFTLVEVLVVIAVIAILAALLFPVFASAKKKAFQTSCANNMHQIGIAILMYRDDWGHYPPIALGRWGRTPAASINARFWMEVERGRQGLIDPYLKNEGVRQCPSRRVAVARYCMNGWSGRYFGQTETSPQGQPEALVPHPASTLLVWEHQVWFPACIRGQRGGTEEEPDPGPGINHWDSQHHDGFNALWCDGHVKRMRYAQLKRRFFTIESDPD